MADKKCLDGTGLRTVADWVSSKFTKKEDFEGLEIGGRNLVLATATPLSLKNDGSGTKTSYSYRYKDVETAESLDETTVTISFDYTNEISSGSCVLNVYWNWHNIIGFNTFNTGSGHYVKTIQLSDATHSGTHAVYLQGNFTGTVTISNFKLEKGNKATDWTPAPEDLAPADHTHNYAGASTAGGSATSAVKLDTSAGSATKPVYFSGGKPVECSYSLQKSVPADANFSNTWRGIQNNLTSASTTDSLAAAQGKALKALVDGKAASSHTHAKSDITDMPTSLPANGGNADTVDGMHAADLVQIIDCPDGTDSKTCVGISGKTTIYRCAGSTAFTDVPELYTRQGTIIAINFSGGGTAGSNVMWVKQIFVSAHAQTYVRYIDGSGVGSWCRDVIDIVIGTSSAQIAYKTGYTKALIEFWKTLVGTGTTASTCSSTVYDSVLVTDLSSSMTAVNGKSISSGPDFSFAYSISTGGAITPSGNFTKYKITYFN